MHASNSQEKQQFHLIKPQRRVLIIMANNKAMIWNMPVLFLYALFPPWLWICAFLFLLHCVLLSFLQLIALCWLHVHMCVRACNCSRARSWLDSIFQLPGQANQGKRTIATALLHGGYITNGGQEICFSNVYIYKCVPCVCLCVQMHPHIQCL